VTRVEFTGTLEQSGGTGGRWIEVPFDGKAEFGEARPPVRGTVNGTPLRSRLSVYGGRTYLGLRAEVRAAAGIDVGDTVAVVLERDDSPREVELPAELDSALAAHAAARDAFDALAFTHRREYAEWIAEAKREETRARRVAKTLEMLHAGVKHP
jgi:hypothetical protein